MLVKIARRAKLWCEQERVVNVEEESLISSWRIGWSENDLIYHCMCLVRILQGLLSKVVEDSVV